MFLNVFRNRKRADIDMDAYGADAARMVAAAQAMPGFVSYQHFHAADGEAVSISEWASVAAAQAWARHPDHLAVQAKGRAHYYESYASYCCAQPRISTFDRSQA